jgi:hypothetical protein
VVAIGKPRLELEEAAAALAAKAALARRHAWELRAQAAEQTLRARHLRAAEAEAVAAARAEIPADAEYLSCRRCGAIWAAEAIRQSTRRRPGCLICGGRLQRAEAPAD